MGNRTEFEQTGRTWFRGLLGSDVLAFLRQAQTDSGRLNAAHPVLHPETPWLEAIQEHWPGMRQVRGVAFSKDADENWAVPWHQDRIIAVSERLETQGFEAWSCKGGVWHCAPPVSVLENMLFVRLHLDDCSAHDGAMEIALGSHRAGGVATSAAAAVAETCETEVTEARAGDVLVMHMLVLHRSMPSQSGVPRRVLRVDLADRPLPAPLEWALAM